MKIRSIKASEILDSRANPTVSATVTLADGSAGTAAVPSGASTGSHEALELRDNDPKRYGGQGVLKAVANVDKIAEQLVGLEAGDQEAIDKTMIDLDGTDNKANLGANAILAVSMAVAVAQAKAEKKHLFAYLAKFNPEHNGQFILPIPLLNIMNGGKHADWATDIQEYMILPIGAKSMAQAVRMGAEVYDHLKEVLKDKQYNLNVGDEGGFAPAVSSNTEPLDLISEAVKRAGYNLGTDIALAIDAAASEFFTGGQYELKKEKQTLGGLELVNFYKDLVNKYPIVSLEDPFAEDDWDNFATLTASLPGRQIVGDDLYVTNLARLKTGIAKQATNSILIKLNQIGTLNETIAVILEAKRNGWTTIISHRSGETEDTFIADLAVAFGTGQIKAGAPARSERTAKYDRLMKIEELITTGSVYAKWPF
jgi:enolase